MKSMPTSVVSMVELRYFEDGAKECGLFLCDYFAAMRIEERANECVLEWCVCLLMVATSSCCCDGQVDMLF
jgi:hypothetical protein